MKKIIFILLTLCISSCEWVNTSDYKYLIMHDGKIRSYTNYYEIKDGCIYFNGNVLCGSFSVYPNTNYKGENK